VLNGQIGIFYLSCHEFLYVTTRPSVLESVFGRVGDDFKHSTDQKFDNRLDISSH
jgi:hypothetical protein